MGNVNTGGNVPRDEENNGPPRNPQGSRYAAVLGPMFGGSFPASVAIYNVIKDSSDIVKLFVFGGLTLGVFAIASGLVATSLATTPETARYAKFAALVAVTIALGLFTAVLCTLFGSVVYKIGCGFVFAALIVLLDGVWMYLER